MKTFIDEITSNIDEQMKSDLFYSRDTIISGAAFGLGGARYKSGQKLVSTGRNVMKTGMPKKGIITKKYNIPKFDTNKIVSGAATVNQGIARKTQGKILIGFGYVWHALH